MSKEVKDLNAKKTKDRHKFKATNKIPESFEGIIFDTSEFSVFSPEETKSRVTKY